MSGSFVVSEQPPWLNPGAGTFDLTLEDLSINENLTPLQRVERFCCSPIPLQRLVHVKLLGAQAISSGLDVTRTVLLPLLGVLTIDDKPIIRQHLSAEVSKIAYFFVSEEGESGYEAFLDCLLPCLARLLLDSRDEVVLPASEAFVASARLVRPADAGRHVLSMVLRLSHDDEVDDRRMTAAFLLSELAPVLGVESTHQFLLPEMVSLSEDPEPRVRRHVAWYMRKMFQVTGGSERLLDAYMALTEDENYRVRRACTESFADMALVVAQDVRGGLLLKVVRNPPVCFPERLPF
jgi:hypothetical protein